MRLFVAVFPPAIAIEHLSALVARLPLTRRAVPPDRWHITLAFLGEVEPALESAAHQALDAVTAGQSAHRSLRARAAAKNPGPRFLPPRAAEENAEENVVENVEENVVENAVEEPGRSRVGDVAVAGGGHFGPVVWAGIEGDLDGLTRLSRAVRREMRARRLRPDDKRFKPHLTLARSDADMSTSDYELLREYRGPSWPVSEMVLVRSFTGPQPAYHPLGTWQLG